MVSIGCLTNTGAVGVTGEKYGSYGEVPIPGSGVPHLPGGEVIVGVRAEQTGGGAAVAVRGAVDDQRRPGYRGVVVPATEQVVEAGSVSAPGSGRQLTPSDEGVRLEQLKTISALRGSGALTEKEFQEQKR